MVKWVFSDTSKMYFSSYLQKFWTELNKSLPAYQLWCHKLPEEEFCWSANFFPNARKKANLRVSRDATRRFTRSLLFQKVLNRFQQIRSQMKEYDFNFLIFLVRHEMSTLGMGFLEGGRGRKLNAQGSLIAHRIGLGPLNKDLQSVWVCSQNFSFYRRKAFFDETRPRNT